MTIATERLTLWNKDGKIVAAANSLDTIKAAARLLFGSDDYLLVGLDRFREEKKQ